MDSLEKIWKAFCITRNPELKERLILEYAPIVKHVAGRMLLNIGQHVEFDELISYGIFGLIDAIDKFDIDKGIKFETYASVRIRGEIIDHIRKMDWVPRTLRQKNRQLDKVYENLEIEMGREPTEEELAEKLNLTLDETRELMKKTAVLSLISLDDYLEQNHEAPYGESYSDDTPERQLDKKELHAILTETISKLSEKEQRVVTLYYFEELTLKEISVIMGVSESRVSQIHSKAIVKMQAKLGRYKSILFS